MARRTDHEKKKIEFGDFQTPAALAADVCQMLAGRGLRPESIVEPTCGIGNFLIAAMSAFPGARNVFGADVNRSYVETVRRRVREVGGGRHVETEVANFFEADWTARIARLTEPILFIGNPPWITSSELGYLKSHNIPEKMNFHGRVGLDAVTGKSNFDISEWMLIRFLSWLDGRRATVAMLCKTAVARKALAFGWAAGFRIEGASIHRIDTTKHFDAAVDACLLVCNLGARAASPACEVFDDIDSPRPTSTLGYRDGMLVADARRYDRSKALMGTSHTWRSGVKHDCAAVMELRATSDGYENGDGDTVKLEKRCMYPMLKSSEVAREGLPLPTRWMIVTQTRVGEDTSPIMDVAPLTWAYLSKNRARFEKRASSIYRGKPPFSIFGVGDYTFAPWKVAISGLYKKLAFKVVGPHHGKPVVMDDTCYFIPCGAEAEARLLSKMLASAEATDFFSAFIFWDAKRPITTDVLRRLDLRRLARVLELEAEYDRLAPAAPRDAAKPGRRTNAAQLRLLG